MRIGVNALYLIPGGVGGTEIYLRNLLAALASIDRESEYVIFTNRETGGDLVPQQSNFEWAPQPFPATFRPARILWEQTRLPLAVKRRGIDVLFNPGFTAPLLVHCPNVTVFHDLQHKVHPENFRWFDLPFWRLLLWSAARRSQGLISVSEATRADLKRFYGVDSTVIHHGVEPAFFEIAERREPGDYLLCVSTLHPHKNLERLIRVHGSMPDAPQLVLTGLRGFAAEKLERAAGPRVRFTGWIPRQELYELYRCARAFIYPSTFEGFGMPVLEAMAAGVPVACSNIPPLREVAGPYAVYFAPNDDNAMKSAIEMVLTNPGSGEPARARAANYTWEETARQTLGYLSRFAR
ncbi:MAG TPA: glycosyltransferase family 1 protein [Bryobacteraceae bacterium]|nr:glycosyltransferase family 1 protein [Bryobacteraceae bacterium]